MTQFVLSVNERRATVDVVKPCARAIAAIRPSSCGTVLPARRASPAILINPWDLP